MPPVPPPGLPLEASCQAVLTEARARAARAEAAADGTHNSRAHAHRRRRCVRVRVQWVRQVQVGELRARGAQHHSSEVGRQLYADNRRARSRAHGAPLSGREATEGGLAVHVVSVPGLERSVLSSCVSRVHAVSGPLPHLPRGLALKMRTVLPLVAPLLSTLSILRYRDIPACCKLWRC